MYHFEITLLPCLELAASTTVKKAMATTEALLDETFLLEE
jgi:hypothetical protein